MFCVGDIELVVASMAHFLGELKGTIGCARLFQEFEELSSVDVVVVQGESNCFR